MLTIGEFSRICWVTRKTLRHYDEIGLLRPEHVAENGYRFYTAGQLQTMSLIARLKGYGFSLPEIAAALANPAPEQLAEKLREKGARIAQDIQQARRVLTQLEQDIIKLNRKEDIMEHNLTVKTADMQPQSIYGVRKSISMKDFSGLFGQLYAELGAKGITPLGPPLAFYHEEDFNPEHSDVEVAVPVVAAQATRQLPGGPHCFVTVVGPYGAESYTPAYRVLATWAEQNGCRISGAPFDKYVRGGDDCPPEEYVTEIYFPIAKA